MESLENSLHPEQQKSPRLAKALVKIYGPLVAGTLNHSWESKASKGAKRLFKGKVNYIYFVDYQYRYTNNCIWNIIRHLVMTKQNCKQKVANVTFNMQ